VNGEWLALAWDPGPSPRVSVVPSLDGRSQLRVDSRELTTLVRWSRFGTHGNLTQLVEHATDVWVGEGGTVVVGPGTHGEPARVFEMSTATH
jgi:hypothetical protein